MNSSSEVKLTQLWSLISLCGCTDNNPMSDSLSASVQVGCRNYPTCLKLNVNNLFFIIESVLLTSFNPILLHTENFLWINCWKKTSCVFDSDINHSRLLSFLPNPQIKGVLLYCWYFIVIQEATCWPFILHLFSALCFREKREDHAVLGIFKLLQQLAGRSDIDNHVYCWIEPWSNKLQGSL